MDAGNMIKPMLARGELRLVGATTLDEYRKHIEKDPAFERRFQQVFVDQPSVEDTIAILRGLKERYEVHHGVRIQDAALVAAAVLSDRYLTGRFIPDKAIDLVDEAASRLRIEIDSMPTEIDVVERRIRQLEIEKVALAKETDAASRERLAALEEELANLSEQSAGMKAHWQAEKDAIAARAASMVQDGQSVLLDIGTTAFRLARQLHGRRITVITSNLVVFEELVDDEGIELVLLGGMVRRDALDGGDDDVAGLLVGLVAGLALYRSGQLDGIVLGLLAHGLEQERLGVCGRHLAHVL
jgi:ATP-dependent Clp protease ATP-binding subunit ClpB